MTAKLRTPTTHKTGKLPTSSASRLKMKQLSVMSFFKPAEKTSNEQEVPLRGNSDKENDDIGSENTEETDTPITSELGMPITHKGSSVMLNSSPVEKGEANEEKQHQANKHLQQLSSPLSRRSLSKRTISYAESDEEEEDTGEVNRSNKKKIRTIDSDEESDFKPEDVSDDTDGSIEDFVDPESENDWSDRETDEEPEKNNRNNNKRTKTSSKVNPNNGNTQREGISSKLSEQFGATSSSGEVPVRIPSTKREGSEIPKSKPKRSTPKEEEERYPWLLDIKDAEKRPVGDPNYDSRTLHIPLSAWPKFTPFEKQYWEVKSKMFDTVVFFKKGKFYELYENDATIANTEFDLKIAGGGRANMNLAGIPEMSFEYWAKEFINHGYKVAKVDQKETLLAKEMRGGSTKEEKIIKRELSGVLTGGTLTNLEMITDDMATYCLSVKENTSDDGTKTFGVAFVDTSTSELNLIEFNDDSECTALETLITQIKPKEILSEKNNLSPLALKLIKFNAHSSHIWNTLNPITEFWDYDTTLENLVKGGYYKSENLDDYSNFPKLLIDFKDLYQCGFNAFGGLLSYLKFLKLDQSIMTSGNMKEYLISQSSSSHLVLNGSTLNNLEIFSNSFDGSDNGTLFKLLNRAITPFGKRMLKKWLLYPLVRINDINERYDTVDFFMHGGTEMRDYVERLLNGLPDLERLLARVHGKSLRFRDFLKVIESYEKISAVVSKMKGFCFRGAGVLSKYILQLPDDLSDLIRQWEDSFDRIAAASDEVIPMAGFDTEFDTSATKLSDLENKLKDHLGIYRKMFKSNEVCYKDSGKEIYLIEVPSRIKDIPHDWQQMGSTSKVKRYWSPEVRKLVRELLEQRETHKMVCDTLKYRMYDKFDQNYHIWMVTLRQLANIDCLLALTKTSEAIGYPSCRPKFVDSCDGSIEFKDMRNPCFLNCNNFIPNDVSLGGKNPNLGLLTGANAAGKSTVMRTTSLSIILSQVGCYLPASHAELTPIDKIMTRLGATDNIMQGKSTFYIELAETKKILSSSTPKSLIIMDELGRGGSSSDGYSIAEAVLHHLATHIQSLGFFATHYVSLGLSFELHPQVKPMRMAILIDESSRNITFLYKLEEGTAPGSFGLNVALMCGIPASIVNNAEEAAKKYEQTSIIKKHCVSLNALKFPLGLQSDFTWLVNKPSQFFEIQHDNENVKMGALSNIFQIIEKL